MSSDKRSKDLVTKNILVGFAATLFFCLQSAGQTATQTPIVVQPGAPGQPTRVLSANVRGKLPPSSKKDVEFMQGMIMHHAQAVEMTDLISERTKNKDIRLIGARISKSQSDEMAFMKRWLEVRGESLSMKMEGHSHGAGQSMLMPGMLTSKQMETLKDAVGVEFDRLFLRGMIQHHKGALVMVDELLRSAGTGQDAELFNFSSDVDTGQRAEIRSMETLLDKKP